MGIYQLSLLYKCLFDTEMIQVSGGENVYFIVVLPLLYMKQLSLSLFYSAP